MIEALLLAAAEPAMTAIDAERAFAADAQKLGQWTAFRRHAADDALMFVPQPVKAHDFLRDKVDPPKAVWWQPMASFVSCDGELAVNHGPVLRPDGSGGHFTTVWIKQKPAAGVPEWRWVYDAGQNQASAFDAPAQPIVRKASCSTIPSGQRLKGVKIDQGQFGHGQSPDGSLAWYWAFSPQKVRWFHLEIWNGKKFETVIDQQVDPKFQGLAHQEPLSP